MEAVEININQIKEYIENSFFEDYESVYHFDAAYVVTTYTQISDIVFDKIKNEYGGCKMFGVEEGGEKIGYFLYEPELLISFALNKQYRNKEQLTSFWELIKGGLGDTFQCMLHSVNRRAINWLNRSGMKILFDSVTILQTN